MQIGIIGYGEFGKFIYELATAKFPAAKIKVYSRSHKSNKNKFFSLDDVCNCDLIIPCVPISAFEQTITEIANLISSSSLLIEVCSVKVHPAKILAKYNSKINFIATHPMFGPNSFKDNNYDLTGKKIVLTEHNLDKVTYKEIINILSKTGLDIVETSAHEHDKLAAQTQFITHLIGRIFNCLDAQKTKIDTYSYQKLFDAIEIVKTHNNLFEEIYMYNPYAREELTKFINAVIQIQSKLKS
jgi:prephenate dehydrogenase